MNVILYIERINTNHTSNSEYVIIAYLFIEHIFII